MKEIEKNIESETKNMSEIEKQEYKLERERELNEIKEKEKDFKGKFITHVPVVRLV